MTYHSRTYIGRRVLIELENGERFVDRFRASHSRYIELENYGRLDRRRIKFMSMYHHEVDRVNGGYKAAA